MPTRGKRPPRILRVVLHSHSSSFPRHITDQGTPLTASSNPFPAIVQVSNMLVNTAGKSNEFPRPLHGSFTSSIGSQISTSSPARLPLTVSDATVITERKDSPRNYTMNFTPVSACYFFVSRHERFEKSLTHLTL